MIKNRIPSDSAKWLVRQLHIMGIPPELVLEGTGLSEAWLQDEDALIMPVQYLRIVNNALNETGDSALGLNLGRKENLADEGIWGYAILSSPTLGEANRVAQQFWALNGALVTLSYQIAEDNIIWKIYPAFPIDSSRIWIFAVEELLSTFFFAARYLSNNQFRLTDIQLSYPDPGYGHYYQKMFSCPVHFTCDVDLFRASIAFNDQHTYLGQPRMAALCQTKCAELLAILKGADEVIDAIRKIIISSPGQSLHLPDIACRMAISSRTLRRRLQERGMTYQQILDEVRTQIAKEYLKTTNLSADQISDRLGFSETAAFRRAFKKWTGLNTKAYRKYGVWTP